MQGISNLGDKIAYEKGWFTICSILEDLKLKEKIKIYER
jgi:hypothetical protein